MSRAWHQPHLHSRGSCRCRAHTYHTAALPLGAGSCTAHCGCHRLHPGSRGQSSGRLGKDGGCGLGHAVGCAPLPASCKDTHGYRRGSRGNQGCTPGRWCQRSQGGSDTPHLHCRADPEPPGGRSRRLQETQGQAMGAGSGPPTPHLQASVQSQAPAHLGSQGSHGGRGDSGHSEGHRTRAGTGSGQPRRSPRAGSPRCCSHTLWGGEGHRVLSMADKIAGAGPPYPLGRPCSHWQRGKWK